MTTTEVCAVCGQDADWHRDNRPQHKFQTEAGPLTAEAQPSDSQQEKPRLGLGDPILRIALIQAGVLTTADIDKAQELFNHAKATGEPIVIVPGSGRDNPARSGMGTDGGMWDPLPEEGEDQGSSPT